MSSATDVEIAAMRRALELAALGPFSPNPLVGCVLLADDGTTVAEGHHRGAGTAHAEADALNQAGERARGTTAV
ncbi:MAG: bifunctional diaminohydroxyphosphoribosylaminopyrimidine deaminase/5-amino-6-(5-phosphoribosylamino)uracil reductase RibD, partial [Solirubrobacteraceae bacterium]